MKREYNHKKARLVCSKCNRAITNSLTKHWFANHKKKLAELSPEIYRQAEFEIKERADYR